MANTDDFLEFLDDSTDNEATQNDVAKKSSDVNSLSTDNSKNSNTSLSSKSSVSSLSSDRKTVNVDENVHLALKRFAGELQAQTGKSVTQSDAIAYLLGIDSVPPTTPYPPVDRSK